uniref:Uncharacterized protein n=1 Tax=Chenopodium quinoa TaxID=63459 RepID=A0A803M628_CHEQI
MGHIYVNCDGACYFFVTGKGICRPIYNNIFDWSMFEVILPNSLNVSLRKNLEQKENEIKQSKASFEVANKNMKELEYQLSLCRKENEDMTTKIKLLQGEHSLTKDESTKMTLESLEKEANEVKDYRSLQASKNEHDHQHNKVEILEKVSEHLHSVSSKVKSTNQKLEQALVSKLWNTIHREDLPVFIPIEGVDN